MFRMEADHKWSFLGALHPTGQGTRTGKTAGSNRAPTYNQFSILATAEAKSTGYIARS